MTNPDNVGGLLPCPFCGGAAERIDFGPGSGDNEGGSCIACTKCQASGPVEFGYKENFVSNWNRRELCRAAPAGGDSPVAEIGELNGTKLIVGRDEDALARLPKGTKLYTRPQDSAPAGSGEVEGFIRDLEKADSLLAKSKKLSPEILLGRVFIKHRAALLRKLQQGADGWRPIDSAPKDGRRVLAFAGARPFIARHGRTVGWWDDNDLMRDPTHWRPLPDSPASQGQEGGHG